MGVSGGQRHAPAALYPRYPLYRRLGGPKGSLNTRVTGKILLLLPGIEPRLPGLCFLPYFNSIFELACTLNREALSALFVMALLGCRRRIRPGDVQCGRSLTMGDGWPSRTEVEPRKNNSSP
jgi:hypothetical protein